MYLNRGSTRVVIITKKWAFKLPTFKDGWKFYLKGLLANIHEVEHSHRKIPELAPIPFYIPGGFLVIMPTVEQGEYLSEWILRASQSKNAELLFNIVENKNRSIGLWRGEIVAIDYGTSILGPSKKPLY